MNPDTPQTGHTHTGSRSRATVALLALIIATAVVLGRRSWAGGEPIVQELSGTTMGTTYSIKFVARSLTADRYVQVQLAVDDWLAEVDGAMSTYKPDSELSRFNRHESTEPFPVSPGVLAVFLLAQQVSVASDGAFDVTVGPLVDAWGFGPDGYPEAIPDNGYLGELREHVGFRKIAIDSAATSLVKRDPRVVADLSAIAKGYAVDGVADVLVDQGFTDFLVEVGGELRSSGEKLGGVAWVVGVEAPFPDARRLYATMEIADESVATSGDYRNFWEADGLRYSHIIDPRTGRPLPYVGAGVTVLHERAVLADAWATAMTVLGPQGGVTIADEVGLGVIFVRQGEEGLEETRTRALGGRQLELLSGPEPP
jgi:thiamine biosynthesis lipoprotein